MIQKHKVAIIFLAIVIACGAFYYGATTAPRTQSTKSTQSVTVDPSVEFATIKSVLEANYPLIKTEYSINKGKLYENGTWYGTTLTYKGSDSLNRDTLRVLLQKRQNVWILRTTPPTPLLSVVDYPDVPRAVLVDINKPISLPAAAN